MNVRVKSTSFAAVCIAALAFLIAAGAAGAQDAGNLSSVEKIYADLAKLPPQERQKQIEDGARKEGKLDIIQTLRGTEGSGHLALFKKRYPFVDLDATLDIGAQDAAGRLLAEETAGRHLTDVIVTSVPDLSELLLRNYLARYPTPADDLILPQYKKFIDPQNRWVAWLWTEQGISYNPTLVPADKVPKKWPDLCDPFFKGGVSFETLETRYLSGVYAMLGEDGTQKFLQCSAANNPIIQRGHSQRAELMIAGDSMIETNYLYYGLELQKKKSIGALQDRFYGADLWNGGRSRHQPQYAASLYVGIVCGLVALAGKPGIRRLAGTRAGRCQASLPARYDRTRE